MSSPYGLESADSCVACKLRCDSYFCSLPRRSLRTFEKIKFANPLPGGSTLFVAGQMPAGIYIVCAGRVKLCMQTAAGTHQVVKVVGPGEILGLHSCVQRVPHELSAETLQPCHVVFVRIEDFLRLLRKDVDVCWRTAQALSRICHTAHDVVRSVALRHFANEKIARLLLDLGASATEPAGSTQLLQIPFTRQEIADSLGISRQTVRRQLDELRQQQVARLEGRTLVIQDREALRRLASGHSDNGRTHKPISV